MAKAKYVGPAEALVRYESVVATHGKVDRKGAANPYTSLNGHMFSFLDKAGEMSLRLSKADQQTFLDRYDSRIPVQYDHPMKEYVVIPDDMLSDTEAAVEWFNRSHDWIASLEPKPTKKPGKKAAGKKPAKKAAVKKSAAKKSS